MEQTIYKKLIKVQQEIGAIAKDSKNPFFKSNYFDINSLLAEVKPVLNENGLIVMQPLQTDGQSNTLLTLLIDAESGEKIDSSVIIPEQPDAQKMGSAITYYRRYALQSMLGLQAEDDDGNKASGNKVSGSKAKPAQTFNPEKTMDKLNAKKASGKVPTCSICGEKMKYSEKAGKFWCKHEADGIVAWGEPIYDKPVSENDKKFLKDLDASQYGG